jgi:phosphohistidine phosphatase SixA
MKSILVVIALLLGVSSVTADTLYVASIAEPGGDGRSWNSAYRYLTTALDAWKTGDQIWVAQGTYRADDGEGRTRGDRTASFVIRQGMLIFGGFKLGETKRELRDWFRYPSVLNGDLENNDGDAVMADDPRRAENTRHILDLRNEAIDSTTIINGLTIVRGNADIEGGGGAIIGTGTPRFRNCRFLYNASATVGGAIHATNVRRMALNYCVFERNWAIEGGAVYINNDSIAKGPATYLRESFFINNTARDAGGAVVISNHELPYVSSCVFAGNQVTGVGAKGGAFYATKTCKPYIVNTTFSRNLYANIGGFGAAIAMHAGQVVNSILWGDDAAEIKQIEQLDTTGLSAKITPIANLVRNDWDFGFYQADPQFVDIDNPAGKDRIYGTDDDGLYLQSFSQANNGGFIDGFVNHHQTDIVGNPRLVGRKVDLGAYELQREDRVWFKDLMAEMRAGRLVFMYRHAKTDWGQKDPGPSPECFPGRNLIYEGREQSREIGLHQRALGILVGDVLSSTACRCWETAELMWGRVDKQGRWAGGGRGGPGGSTSTSDQRWKDLDSIPLNGNRIVVTHDGVCQQMFNPGGDGMIITTAEYMEGDALILRPNGDTTEVLAQWSAETWLRYPLRFPDGDVTTVQQEVPVVAGSLHVAPNPAATSINVNVPMPDTFIVIDALGRVLATHSIDADRTLDVAALDAGSYMIKGLRTGVAARFVVAR